MPSAQVRKTEPRETRKEENLQRRYGEIGISAVAAAVRYQSDRKNPAYAPTVQRSSERDDDAAR